MPLSVDHIFAIEDFIVEFAHDASRGRASPASASSPGSAEPIELRLYGDDLVLEPIDQGVSAEWVATPVDPECDAVGLCLPAGVDLHLGAVVDHFGEIDGFVVDDGLLLFERLRSTALIEDLCRRRLGLATDPPAHGTDWYWLLRWLMEVTVHIGVDRDPERPRLDVVTVAGLHPAVDVEELVGLDRAGIADFVRERHRDHATRADWECVRLDAVIDHRHVAHPWARLLDHGAFSRWIGSQGVPLSALADDIIAGCSPFAIELVGSVIADLVVRQEAA